MDDGQADPPAGRTDSERLDSLENAVGRIESALARVLPGSHAEARQRTEQRLDRPTTVEEQTQAELARAREEGRQEERDAAAKVKADGERQAADESVQSRLAKLEEKPPAPPTRRAERIMWGARR